MATLRRATADDIPRLAGLLARAFYDNPIERWLLPDDDRRMAALTKFQAMRLRVFDLPIGDVWTTTDVSACAKWVAPGGPSRQGDLARVQPLALLPMASLLSLMGPGLPRAVRALATMRQVPEDPPHWHLASLATDPPRQGHGEGSALLAAGLERSDAEGVPSGLECSAARNLTLYRRHGFEVTSEVQLPGGPTVWRMWREAAR